MMFQLNDRNKIKKFESVNNIYVKDKTSILI